MIRIIRAYGLGFLMCACLSAFPSIATCKERRTNLSLIFVPAYHASGVLRVFYDASNQPIARLITIRKKDNLPIIDTAISILPEKLVDSLFTIFEDYPSLGYPDTGYRDYSLYRGIYGGTEVQVRYQTDTGTQRFWFLTSPRELNEERFYNMVLSLMYVYLRNDANRAWIKGLESYTFHYKRPSQR